MASTELTMRIDVAGIPEVLQRARAILADAVRQVAATETDARVVIRLHEVAALITQDLAAAEARHAQQNVVPHPERRPLAARVPKPEERKP